VTSGYGAPEVDAERATLPQPGWEPLTEEFWREAGRGRLSVQQCQQCGAQFFPPSAACYNCQSMDLAWTPVPGTGTVFSYTWADYPPSPDGSDRNITVVELDGTQGPDPVRMIGWVVDVPRDQLHIGLPVEVTLLPFDEELAVPAWRPRG
jgi:uncharacterized OB-fold protein